MQTRLGETTQLSMANDLTVTYVVMCSLVLGMTATQALQRL